jgi:hypothetical protein
MMTLIFNDDPRQRRFTYHPLQDHSSLFFSFKNNLLAICQHDCLPIVVNQYQYRIEFFVQL